MDSLASPGSFKAASLHSNFFATASLCVFPLLLLTFKEVGVTEGKGEFKPLFYYSLEAMCKPVGGAQGLDPVKVPLGRPSGEKLELLTQ